MEWIQTRARWEGVPRSWVVAAHVPWSVAHFYLISMVDDEISCEVMNLLLGVPSTCVDLQNDFGETALFLAASSGRAGHVYALLRAGADRFLANRISGQTAVEAAIGDARTIFTAAA